MCGAQLRAVGCSLQTDFARFVPLRGSADLRRFAHAAAPFLLFEGKDNTSDCFIYIYIYMQTWCSEFVLQDHILC